MFADNGSYDSKPIPAAGRGQACPFTTSDRARGFPSCRDPKLPAHPAIGELWSWLSRTARCPILDQKREMSELHANREIMTRIGWSAAAVLAIMIVPGLAGPASAAQPSYKSTLTCTG